MNFNRKTIKRRKLRTHYSQKKNQMRKMKDSKSILRFITYTLVFFIFVGVILSFILYHKYIKDLPSVKELENLEIAEASTIYDREGGELYKIYKEKRTYVPFEDINTNMVNAIIAGEDKRYWENPGFDIIGIVRAVIYRVLGKTDKLEGTSTLTQQLIRNTIIANERKIERKIKEIYLSYKLSQGLSKEKVLELYLNKISFGHNSFGIEQAAQTFFSKNAKDLNILESSILASLPKGPTYYSPYNHPDRVIGYPYFYPKEEEEKQEHITKIISQKDKILYYANIDPLLTFIKNMKATPLEGTSKILICNLKEENFKISINIDKDGCHISEYSKLLNLLNGLKIESEENFVEYQTGRKDFILGRMLEDGYINFDEYKNAILDAIGMKLSNAREEIGAPHFVFFVKELLEEKYGEEIVESGGLKIYTTLDPKLQEKAEEIVASQSEKNLVNFNAANAAVVTLDNETGEILAMVGGKDYFDQENNGNVNIITSRLQPGSTFKPFVYSMAIFKEEIGSKTPIYDVPTKFDNYYEPSNFDGKFFGKMNISTALNNSRNIPAIKMFSLAGGESEIVNFMEKLGVTSLKKNNMYGSPIALGTGEMTALELASAYSVFANMGSKTEVTPILKIVDSKGNTIEEKKETKGEEVMSKGQAYIINKILSDTYSRPETWNSFLTIGERDIAAKTGTSTKQYKENGKEIIAARNLWTIGYTPQFTTVAWAGNTDGTPLNARGNGLEGAGPIMRGVMEFAHKGKPIKNWNQPKEVEKITISEVSGFLPNPETASNSFLTTSLFINKPTLYDQSFQSQQVDMLCNGIVTESTPSNAIKNVSLVEFHSLQPANPRWETPVQTWANSIRPTELEGVPSAYYESKEKYGILGNIVTHINNSACQRTQLNPYMIVRTTIEENEILSLGENHIELAYRGDLPIIRLDILIENSIIKQIPLKYKKEGAYIGSFEIPEEYKGKKAKLSFKIIDSEYNSYKEEKNVIIEGEDTIAPEIEIENPVSKSIKIYSDSYFNLRADVNDRSQIKEINIKINDETIFTLKGKRKITYPVNMENDIPVGLHTIEVEAIDSSNNTNKELIDLEVLAR